MTDIMLAWPAVVMIAVAAFCAGATFALWFTIDAHLHNVSRT